MQLYVIVKNQGRWANGSSKSIVEKLCDLIDLKDVLVYTEGKPHFINSKLFISVSHCENLMVIAFDSTEIGIDLEKNRDIKKEVIDRVTLDENNPLMDWCQREATIKLYNDPEYLFKKAPSSTLYKVIEVYDGFTCVVASKEPLSKTSLYHLKESSL
jgi:succinyl-CoA synthetase beta subunit